MEGVVEEIKKKIDIVSFIGAYITLKRTGRNFKALCPFHHERTASFIVSPDRQIWHCFGACQDGGDVIKFLMKWENFTFIEALRELADKTGIKLKKIDFVDSQWKRKERLISINFLAAEFFEYILERSTFGQKAQDYIKSRKIDPKIRKLFQIGYAPASWDSLFNFLKKKKYDPQEIFDTGLLVKSERGGYYDRFRGRIIFPIKDARGNIIGFSGRILDDRAKEAKYINTPETLLYRKRETLFGIDLAKEAIKKTGNVIITEGEFDVISPYQLGIENIVGIKGSAVTREQLMFLKRYTNRVTLALDSDLAGEEAVKRGVEEAENLEFEISVVTFDFAKDPDEAIKKDEKLFKKVIKKPVPFYDFIISYSQKKNPDNDSFSKKRIADEVGFFIEKIRNPIIQSHYIKKLAAILDVSEESIISLIKKIKDMRKQRPLFFAKKRPSSKESRATIIQKYLLSIIFQSNSPFDLAEEVFKILSIDDFLIPAYQKICQYFFEYKENNQKFDIKKFIKILPAELQPVFDEVYLFASSDFQTGEKSIDRIVYEVKKLSLKKKIAEILSSEEEESDKIKDDLKRFNQELSRVEKLIAV